MRGQRGPDPASTHLADPVSLTDPHIELSTLTGVEALRDVGVVA